jgi:hypothetical protein
MRHSKIHWLWRDRPAPQRFGTGVSLHSHTLHSEETMAFIPRYTSGIPIVSNAIKRQEEIYRQRRNRTLDFSRAFWRPPLAPHEAVDLETQQLEALDLQALVSLSDHDNIQAGSMLRVVDPQAPISVEWTTPFAPSFFHLGIHNLPPHRAPALMSDFAEFTKAPSKTRLAELLAALNELREVLIVMNHPLWDEARVGVLEHAQLAGRFLERFGEHVHALELNGLRPWRENQRVMWLAEHSGHALVSGGDRHGREPNANVNLTNTRTLVEFVSEVRDDGFSDILFMPQYREPLRLRMIDTMCDIVRDYPDLPAGRRRWCDRVFYRDDDGVVKPLAAFWQGNEPWPVKFFLGGLRTLRSRQMRAALRFALADPQEVPA